MDAKVQRWVQRSGWDRAVDEYETFWRDQLRPAHQAVLGAADLAAGERVIDIACGTGMVTLPAARAVGPSGLVLATDLSPRMLDDVARRATEEGLDNVEVRHVAAEDLGPVGSFDVALCSLGLMYVPAPAVAMQELARVLRPDGRAVVAVWGERHRCGWAGVFPIVEARVTSDVCPMFFALGAPGALVGLAERVGLVDIEDHRVETELVYADDSAAIGAAFLGGPVALAHSRFDELTRTSAYDDYLHSIAPFHDGAGYRIPGEFVIVSGRIPAVGRDLQPTNHQHHNQQGALT